MPRLPLLLLGYAVAVVMAGTGVAVLAGYFGTEDVPSQLRITLGVVLVLFGAYRAAMTATQARQGR